MGQASSRRPRGRRTIDCREGGDQRIRAKHERRQVRDLRSCERTRQWGVGTVLLSDSARRTTSGWPHPTGRSTPENTARSPLYPIILIEQVIFSFSSRSGSRLVGPLRRAARQYVVDASHLGQDPTGRQRQPGGWHGRMARSNGTLGCARSDGTVGWSATDKHAALGPTGGHAVLQLALERQPLELPHSQIRPNTEDF